MTRRNPALLRYAVLGLLACDATRTQLPADRDAGVFAAPDARAGDASNAHDGAAPAEDAGTVDPRPCPNPSADALFVATTGHPEGPGTSDAPFSSIAEALAVAEAGDQILVRGGVYSELVSFPRDGEPGAPITLRAACNETVVLDGTGLGAELGTPALIQIADRSHIVVEGFELTGLRGVGGNFPAGIWVRGASSDVVLRGNRVHAIAAERGGDGAGAHGIAVYGTAATPTERVTIQDNELFDLVLGWSEALVVNGNVRHFEVTGNTVHDVNNIAFDFIGFEQDVCPRCSQADELDSPDLNRARQGVISDNRAYRVTSLGNPAYGSDKSAGCFYVDGGAALVLERNVAHDCDLGVELASEHFGKSTRSITVRNNVLYDNDVAGIATGGYSAGTGEGGGSARDCLVLNNTVLNSSRAGWADAALLLQNRNVRNTYKNNILVASPGGLVVRSDGAGNQDNSFDHNLYFGGELEGQRPGPHALTADPKLSGPSEPGGYHLTDGSPAIDAGEDLGVSVLGERDIDGDPRVMGTVDIGADERR